MCSKIGKRECVDLTYFASKIKEQEKKFVKHIVKFGEFNCRLKNT